MTDTRTPSTRPVTAAELDDMTPQPCHLTAEDRSERPDWRRALVIGWLPSRSAVSGVDPVLVRLGVNRPDESRPFRVIGDRPIAYDVTR